MAVFLGMAVLIIASWGSPATARGADSDYEGASGDQNFDAAGDVGGTFGHWAFRDGMVENIRILGD
ncbi:MAG: hypothetical protein O7C63_02050 [Alphaproteobacteria bacterium]|nr:hypothetical protein [Alphaproteobacteria bacterium]MCZ6763697.1 hypothetical protein [Alphaproteobacteria bacterium]